VLRAVVLALLTLVLGAGCTSGSAESSWQPSPSVGGDDESGRGVTPSVSPTPEDSSEVRFDVDRAMRTVRLLAGRIGPREATSAAFDEAADIVAARLTELGYDVSQPGFRVPSGVSWGVAVPSGRTRNIVAVPHGLQHGDRYLIVGAHLDTVPQAPGAEDNASGVATLLELARLAGKAPTRLPVVFVAFGAEEPRGPGDDWHHFGSRSFTARMSRSERRHLAAMVSLDRVGVGDAVPVCGGGLTDSAVVAGLRRAGDRADVRMTSCGVNRSSDHWSFERVGLPAARIGSTAYPQYHSELDRPHVVERSQLRRAGLLMWEYLAPR
jgi:aminopeptidase YwaD